MVAPITPQAGNAPDTPGVPVRLSGVLKRVSGRLASRSSRPETVANPDSPRPVDRTKRGVRISSRSGLGPENHVYSAKPILGDCTGGEREPIFSEAGSTEHSRAMPKTLTLEMCVLARQTENRLLVLARDVSECKSVDEAANFTRWLSSSGVLSLLERFSTGGPLPVDGKSLRKLSEKIYSDCCDLFRNGKATPRYAASDIAEINRKLDIIAAHIGQGYGTASNPSQVAAESETGSPGQATKNPAAIQTVMDGNGGPMSERREAPPLSGT